MRVQRDDGEWIEGEEEVKTEIVEFYKKIYLLRLGEQKATLGDIGLSTLTKRQPKNLVKEVTKEEIKQAVFGKRSDRAPGPDGFPVEFFKSNWEVIGQDVINGVKWFF